MSNATVACACVEDGGPPIADCSACNGSGVVMARCEPGRHRWYVDDVTTDEICSVCDALKMPDGEVVWPRRGSRRRKGTMQ